MDFGIAQMVDQETLTATGTMLGSPAHMAPEVVEGEISAKSDLFSVGTVLYWLVCGVLPFAGPSPAALFRRIAECRFDPVLTRRPQAGRAIARLIERCMAHDPDDRPASAGAVAEALRGLLDEAGLPDAAGELAAFLKDRGLPGSAAGASGPRLFGPGRAGLGGPPDGPGPRLPRSRAEPGRAPGDGPVPAAADRARAAPRAGRPAAGGGGGPGALRRRWHLLAARRGSSARRSSRRCGARWQASGACSCRSTQCWSAAPLHPAPLHPALVHPVLVHPAQPRPPARSRAWSRRWTPAWRRRMPACSPRRRPTPGSDGPSCVGRPCASMLDRTPPWPPRAAPSPSPWGVS
ncbi:MAG: protein kinase [bacterium]